MTTSAKLPSTCRQMASPRKASKPIGGGAATLAKTLPVGFSPLGPLVTETSHPIPGLKAFTNRRASPRTEWCAGGGDGGGDAHRRGDQRPDCRATAAGRGDG